ncbi:MAG TPA: TIGR00730 family Rossman fold protein [Spirochaetota bacterium]|nr:TIGR00730 family Rossman fold protein [Spirochaetota bacterium]
MRPEKAYKNMEFLNSREARVIRIMCEYMEPEKRFKHYKIRHTVVFFGSARARQDDPLTMQYYHDAYKLSYLLAQYGKELEAVHDGFVICTGGGPGIMEAANKGANEAGVYSIGLNISLPFEQIPNQYISQELNFEFHYFFMRKLWFLYHAKAIVVFPGGYGTLDELFETLTLVQTNKLQKQEIPIVLYDENYWNKLINFQMLIDYGYIDKNDFDLIHFCNSPEEGIEYLKPRLKRLIEKVNHTIEEQ